MKLYRMELDDETGEDLYTEVSDADLAAMGLVQAPECGECEDGVVWLKGDNEYHEARCPKCGGSGYGRLVSLDAETIQSIRWFYEGRANDEMVRASEVHRMIVPILAALDGEGEA